MMTLFVILVAEFMYRYINDKPLRKKASTGRVTMDTRRQILLLAMAFTTFLLFIRYADPSSTFRFPSLIHYRGVYRLIELSGGWDSDIMRTEWPFSKSACIFSVVDN